MSVQSFGLVPSPYPCYIRLPSISSTSAVMFLTSRKPLREATAFVVLTLLAAFVFGAINLKIWSWRGFWTAYQISVIFYLVFSVLIGLIAPRIRSLLVPTREWPRGRAMILDVAVYVTLSLVGTFISFSIARILVGVDVLADAQSTYLYAFIAIIITLTIASSIYAVYFYRKMIHQINELKEAREAALNAELKALRAQINPHFLFNTLNSISQLTASDPSTADVLLQKLADVFRYVLGSFEKETVTLSEELDFIRDYLEIEKVRFGTKLTVRIEADPAMDDFRLPGLIVQPLVENAIKHGIADSLTATELIIETKVEMEMLIVTVSDNGVGMDPVHLADPRTLAKNGGIGIENIRKRLQALYGTDCGPTLLNRNSGGLSVVLKVPLKMPRP